ncbi:hypothetical protein AGRA3207_007779 [Actinomadura graeca]|uniref:Integral membrane protein n=1 Tax=Actinomadura graeca TaxID=2750812 RepID=A0ABX8R6V9_9ACTN|nr:hypothetical protein [Actinomadura graeca]QXJ26164.1 hypothetical protein AGRA3207_007779 [Actinomadura graeca]
MRITCPGCRTPLPPPRHVSCPVCGLGLAGPVAAELWAVDGHLARLGRRRRELLAMLYASPPPGPAGPRPAPASAPAPGAAAARHIDASRSTVRNTLLGVGGTLLGIAAVVFTVLSWSTLGAVPRALVLLALTGVALGAAWMLAKRALAATAETLAFIGLLLVLLQVYAAYANGLLGLDGVGGRRYAAAASLAVAAVWALYDRVAPLRLTRPTAVVLAQFPLPLAAVAADATPEAMALVLLVLSLADLGARRLERGTATVTGLIAGAAGTLTASWPAAASVPVAPAGAALLLAAALVALAWAFRVHPVLAVVTGLAGSAALTAVLPLPLRWTAAGCALSAVAVAAAAWPLRGRLRHGAWTGAAIALAASVAWVAPGAFAAALFPGRYLDARWAGVGSPDLMDWILPATPVVLALLAAVLVAAGARAAAPPAALLAVLTAAVATQAPYPAALALGVASAAALAAWAALDRPVRLSAGAAAVAASLWAAAYSLAAEDATIAVLGALALAAAGCAVAFPVLRDGAAAAAVLFLGGLGAAVPLAAGLPARHAAFAVLAAAGCGILATWAVRAGTGPAMETAPWPVAAAGVAMTAGHAAPLSLALAVTGVLAAAVALRPGRRPAAWAASALLLAAWWVRLGASEVTVPEVYTAPVSAALLALGLVRRARGTARSSWADFGPALASTLVPSLLAAWADATGPRPLLLAAAALAITLAGARARLQAPLVLGGAVLVLAAARRLAPYAADALGSVPGWIPIACLGLLTLLAGATYEQRMRDLRRLRAALGRLT